MKKLLALITIVLLSGCYTQEVMYYHHYQRGYVVHRHITLQYQSPKMFIVPSRVYKRRGF